jgi:hypothetical protein
MFVGSLAERRQASGEPGGVAVDGCRLGSHTLGAWNVQQHSVIDP